MRYFIHLGYQGTHYSGWQRQINTEHTIQEIVENKLAKIFRKAVTAYGCGRTDAGVHASQYIMHIDLEEAPTFDLKFRLNKNLPDAIAIFDIVEVTLDQHCRYDAIDRTYDYFIHWEKDCELYRSSSFYEGLDFDFEKMLEACKLIARTKDFRPLCKHPDIYKNTICEVSKCRLFLNEEMGRMRFSITANRFLRGMVRYSVNFLLEVGTGALSLSDFDKILNQEMELSEKKPAHPNGLFLSKVRYPYLEFKNKHQLITMLKLGLG
jgi:tRNA pseudouridine38-40 synthase